MMFLVDRIDNQDGTHTLLVDHVQVGQPIAWDDLMSEHLVRETCNRIERGLPESARRTLIPIPNTELFQAGGSKVQVLPLDASDFAELRRAGERAGVQQPSQTVGVGS